MCSLLSWIIFLPLIINDNFKQAQINVSAVLNSWCILYARTVLCMQSLGKDKPKNLQNGSQYTQQLVMTMNWMTWLNATRLIQNLIEPIRQQIYVCINWCHLGKMRQLILYSSWLQKHQKIIDVSAYWSCNQPVTVQIACLNSSTSLNIHKFICVWALWRRMTTLTRLNAYKFHIQIHFPIG